MIDEAASPQLLSFDTDLLPPIERLERYRTLYAVGAEVTELIQGYVVAMNLETTEEELMHTVFPHPTLSEMMKEAVLDAYGRVLNV